VNEIGKTPLAKKHASALAAAEVVLIFLLFFIFAGWVPPDVNEAHYLAKAKHYWNPEWCRGDLFLESAQAHLFFYWTFGWLTLLLPLPTVAWIGRLVTWGALAWAWQRLSFAVVPRPLMSVLTASLFLLFHSSCHMAGEWVVGGVEAKGLAYVFVMLAVEAMVRQRWRRVWIFLGIATSLHVLVGGWSWIAAAIAWLACGRYRPPLLRPSLPRSQIRENSDGIHETPNDGSQIRENSDDSSRAEAVNPSPMMPAIVLGLLLAVPGLAAGLMLAQGADAEAIRNANVIYVYHRLDHHLVFHRFPHLFIFRHALLLVAWLTICFLTVCRISACNLGQRPLRGFVAGTVLIAFAGIVIDQSMLYHLEVAASLLKYYWYRLSDVFLPVGVAIAIGGLIDRWWLERPRAAQWLLIAALLVSGTYLGWTNIQRRSDLRPRADVQMLPSWPDDPVRTRRKYEDWRRVCQWIAENTPADAVFVTPRNQQTFKWYAERAEVFSWKDVPQDPVSVVQWWERQQQLYPRRVVRWGFAVLGEDRLVELARQYGARYIVVDRDSSTRDLMLPQVYPVLTFLNPSYAVYRVPDAAESTP
jgi:hypothetical protein